MKAVIAVLGGDGIGPEVAASGLQVLRHVAGKYGHKLQIREQLIGGAAIDATGDPLPPDTIASCLDSDAVVLGAVGGPKWSDPNAAVRP
ncbi:MAG TPA: isocitrate/isopropylmalate family dehydrogenase, partial [Woeseiaceae bacterium]|nr:isocitrate/isopropylmalate family dehydrogenase [Woeseiaceae bacterium]